MHGALALFTNRAEIELSLALATLERRQSRRHGPQRRDRPLKRSLIRLGPAPLLADDKIDEPDIVLYAPRAPRRQQFAPAVRDGRYHPQCGSELAFSGQDSHDAPL